MRFLGTLPQAVGTGLESVVTGVLAGGAPEPSWIAVDDGTDGWVAAAVGCSAAERARGVVAASSDAALVTAQRLGIGGAMWLPPSSLGAKEAFASADSRVVPAEGYDAALVELLDDGEAVVIVTFVEPLFWRAQLGERRLVALLAELAAALGAPSAILPWPALVIQGVDSSTIAEGLRAIVLDAERVLPDVTVTALETGAPESAAVEAVYRELLEDRPPGVVVGQGGRPLPVHELPHGRRVGWWNRHSGEVLPEGEWSASPEGVARPRWRWRLNGEGGSGIIEEVLTSEDVDHADECVAVRFPGWASRDIRSGSPAGLLVTRLAETAARRGLPLWIPNLDRDALRLALTLPGVLWVDGPAVPR